jgi:hypothetical protein
MPPVGFGHALAGLRATTDRPDQREQHKGKHETIQTRPLCPFVSTFNRHDASHHFPFFQCVTACHIIRRGEPLRRPATASQAAQRKAFTAMDLIISGLDAPVNGWNRFDFSCRQTDRRSEMDHKEAPARRRERKSEITRRGLRAQPALLLYSYGPDR